MPQRWRGRRMHAIAHLKSGCLAARVGDRIHHRRRGADGSGLAGALGIVPASSVSCVKRDVSCVKCNCASLGRATTYETINSMCGNEAARLGQGWQSMSATGIPVTPSRKGEANSDAPNENAAKGQCGARSRRGAIARQAAGARSIFAPSRQANERLLPDLGSRTGGSFAHQEEISNCEGVDL